MTTLSKKILVVDDEESIKEIMKIKLGKLGYDPKFAENGKDALEILENEEFTLILTDLRMPDINGTELCIKIKEKNPDTVIYAFSGGVTDLDFDQLKEKGFDGLLCKPVTSEVLERAVKGAFDKVNKLNPELFEMSTEN
jgi:two-component system alkaline phosphatase synthesis response regulator PhoP